MANSSRSGSIGDDPTAAGQGAAITEYASGLSGHLPPELTTGPPPDEVRVPLVGSQPTRATLGRSDVFGNVVEIDVTYTGLCVVGPPRSGRTTALAAGRRFARRQRLRGVVDRGRRSRRSRPPCPGQGRCRRGTARGLRRAVRVASPGAAVHLGHRQHRPLRQRRVVGILRTDRQVGEQPARRITRHPQPQWVHPEPRACPRSAESRRCSCSTPSRRST